MHLRPRFFYYQKKQSHKLQDRFPEYDRTVIRPSNEGQSELKARESASSGWRVPSGVARKPPEVTDMRGLVEKSKVKECQVTLSSAIDLKSSRLKKRMIKPGENFEIVNPQTDYLVEVLDACAVATLRFSATRLGMVRENCLCPAPRCGTTVALEIV